MHVPQFLYIFCSFKIIYSFVLTLMLLIFIRTMITKLKQILFFFRIISYKINFFKKLNSVNSTQGFISFKYLSKCHQQKFTIFGVFETIKRLNISWCFDKYLFVNNLCSKKIWNKIENLTSISSLPIVISCSTN